MLTLLLAALTVSGSWQLSQYIFHTAGRAEAAGPVSYKDDQDDGQIAIDDAFNTGDRSKLRNALIQVATRLKLTGLGQVRIERLFGTTGSYIDLDSSVIYLNPDSVHNLDEQLVHELGHLVDLNLMSPDDRRAYCRLRQIPECQLWYEVTSQPGYLSDAALWSISPAEDFAEEFVRFTYDVTYQNHTSYASDVELDDFWSEVLARTLQ